MIIAVLAGAVSSKLKLERQEVLERRGKSAEKWQTKVGKAKMWGYAMALLFFLGDAQLKQWQRGRSLAQARWQLCCWNSLVATCKRHRVKHDPKSFFVWLNLQRNRSLWTPFRLVCKKCFVQVSFLCTVAFGPTLARDDRVISVSSFCTFITLDLSWGNFVRNGKAGEEN